MLAGIAAGDMAKFVGDDALHFIGIVGGGDEAAMDIDNLPARDEGVDVLVIDEDDLDVARLQPCGLNDRRGHIVEQFFGFRVAQNALRLRGAGHHQAGEREQESGKTGESALKEEGKGAGEGAGQIHHGLYASRG